MNETDWGQVYDNDPDDAKTMLVYNSWNDGSLIAAVIGKQRVTGKFK